MIVFQRDNVPPVLNVLHLGVGPDSFIGKVGWIPNYRATGLFEVRWLCASRNTENNERMARNLRVNPENASTDYGALLRKALAEDKHAVVCITTETGQHADHIVQAIEAGANWIIVDKPLVRTLAEYERVKSAANRAGANVFLTFNHLFFAPVHFMRVKARDPVNGIKSIRSWFYQDWLSQKHDFRQFVWRTDDKLCGVADIGTHAANLAAFVVNHPLQSIRNARMSSKGGHGKGDIFTFGTCDAFFTNGVEGTISFDQELKGHLDDIGCMAGYKDGISLMWRLELGADALWVSTKESPDPFNLGDWERHMRGSEYFGAVNAAFGQRPPGHVDGWDNGWQNLFTAAAGKMYAKRGIDLGFKDGEEPMLMKVPVPGLKEGEETTRYIEAMVKANASNDCRDWLPI